MVIGYLYSVVITCEIFTVEARQLLIQILTRKDLMREQAISKFYVFKYLMKAGHLIQGTVLSLL